MAQDSEKPMPTRADIERLMRKLGIEEETARGDGASGSAEAADTAADDSNPAPTISEDPEPAPTDATSEKYSVIAPTTVEKSPSADMEETEVLSAVNVALDHPDSNNEAGRNPDTASESSADADTTFSMPPVSGAESGKPKVFSEKNSKKERGILARAKSRFGKPESNKAAPDAGEKSAESNRGKPEHGGSSNPDAASKRALAAAPWHVRYENTPDRSHEEAGGISSGMETADSSRSYADAAKSRSAKNRYERENYGHTDSASDIEVDEPNPGHAPRIDVPPAPVPQDRKPSAHAAPSRPSAQKAVMPTVNGIPVDAYIDVQQRSIRRLKIWLSIALAIAVAGVAFSGTMAYLNYRQAQTSAAAVQEAAISVVTAKKDIPKGAKISKDDLSVSEVQASNLPEGAVYESSLSSIVGETAASEVKKGDVITSHDVASAASPESASVSSGSTAHSQSRVSGDIGNSQVAISLSGSETNANGGVIRKGDTVNIYSTGSNGATLIVGGANVIAPDSASANDAGNVTVSVSDKTAQAIMKAEANGGVRVTLNAR
jgi:Flp pilus assembly protein CpaB